MNESDTSDNQKPDSNEKKPTETETPRSDRPRSEPPGSEPPRSEPPRSEPPRSEPPRSEPPRSEPPRSEPPRSEPPRSEPPRDEASRAETPRAESPKSETPKSETASAAAGYPDRVRKVLTAPDAHFADPTSVSRIQGLIGIGALLGLLFLDSLISRITRFSSWRFEFDFILHAITVTLAVAIPIAVVIFAFKWLDGRGEGGRSLDFYISRFGDAMILPALLVLVAIPLNLLGATIHGWFRGGALVMVYVAVFAISYAFAAPRQLRTAVGMTLGFYLLYRLMLLLF